MSITVKSSLNVYTANFTTNQDNCKELNSYWHKEVNFFVTIVLKVDGCPRFANNDINKFNKAVIKFASSLCASIQNNVSFLCDF